ncbi:hypothetical protein L0F63_004627 [Massospora cicadina]|nr:hypothetical protein L0F63_004627 [Massospora cicadina]
MPNDYSHLETPEMVKLYTGQERIVKLCTYNVASIKSAAKKGLLEYLKAEQATLVCLQETKLQAPAEGFIFRVRTYVPNAGDGLVRLDYRLKWDAVMMEHLNSLEKTAANFLRAVATQNFLVLTLIAISIPMKLVDTLFILIVLVPEARGLGGA